MFRKIYSMILLLALASGGAAFGAMDALGPDLTIDTQLNESSFSNILESIKTAGVDVQINRQTKGAVYLFTFPNTIPLSLSEAAVVGVAEQVAIKLQSILAKITDEKTIKTINEECEGKSLQEIDGILEGYLNEKGKLAATATKDEVGGGARGSRAKVGAMSPRRGPKKEEKEEDDEIDRLIASRVKQDLRKIRKEERRNLEEETKEASPTTNFDMTLSTKFQESNISSIIEGFRKENFVVTVTKDNTIFNFKINKSEVSKNKKKIAMNIVNYLDSIFELMSSLGKEKELKEINKKCEDKNLSNIKKILEESKKKLENKLKRKKKGEELDKLKQESKQLKKQIKEKEEELNNIIEENKGKEARGKINEKEKELRKLELELEEIEQKYYEIIQELQETEE